MTCLARPRCSAEGSSLLLTALAQYEYLAGSSALHDSWLGGSVADAVLTSYCIEALVPDAPGNDTTYGSLDFADYTSCNNQADKSTPVCSCAVATDRHWGRLDLKHERGCHLTGAPRLPCTLGDTDCTCTCTPEQVNDLPCNIRREGGESLVIGGPSLVILEGRACNPL